MWWRWGGAHDRVDPGTGSQPGTGLTTGGEAPALGTDELLARLRALLSNARPETGDLEADEFWKFVAAVAQGRGITTRLHDAGIEQLEKVAPSPAGTRNERERRAYHIGLLARLLMDIGGPAGRASVLPANFSHAAVVGDLLAMLGGPGGMGEARPQILASERGGAGNLRRHARRALVGAVLWRAAREGRSQAEIRGGLLPDMDKSVWDGWLREVGGANGEFAGAARDAGAAGRRDDYWSWTDEQLGPVIQLARGGQGRRNSE